jgi:threonine aldolase
MRSRFGATAAAFRQQTTTPASAPRRWRALLAANAGHVRSYGDDEWTLRAADRLRELFETDCDVYFVFNGTAANSLALAALCQSYHSVICHQLAHVETDECGAPEFFSNGAKLLAVAGEQGKLTPAAIVDVVTRRSDIHYPKPKVVTLTQATEVGTVYRPTNCVPSPTRRTNGAARTHGRRALRQRRRRTRPEPGRMTWRPASMCCASAAPRWACRSARRWCFFDRRLSEDFAYRCKQAGQLASKMRFLSAPWLGILENGAWLRHAAHANAMARRLAAGLAEVDRMAGAFPGAGQRRLRAPAEPRRGGAARTRLVVLQLHRCRRGAFHVRLGHAAGDRRSPARRHSRLAREAA